MQGSGQRTLMKAVYFGSTLGPKLDLIDFLLIPVKANI